VVIRISRLRSSSHASSPSIDWWCAARRAISKSTGGRRARRIDAARFAGQAAQSLELPITCVIDVGRLRDGAWVLIEANATWGAGLNGCEPQKVVRCLAVASGPAA
jgi:hypothetical protein